MVLTLNKYGTAGMTATDEEDISGTWTETEDSLESTLDAMSLPISLIARYLITDVDGMAFVFGRKAADAFNPGAAVVADAVEAFNGIWDCVKIDMMDMVVGADAMGMSSTFVIDNDVVTQSNYYAGSEFRGEDTMILGNGELVDGKLNLTGENFDGSMVTLYDSCMLEVFQPYAGVMEFAYYYELTE